MCSCVYMCRCEKYRTHHLIYVRIYVWFLQRSNDDLVLFYLLFESVLYSPNIATTFLVSSCKSHRCSYTKFFFTPIAFLHAFSLSRDIKRVFRKTSLVNSASAHCKYTLSFFSLVYLSVQPLYVCIHIKI